MDALVRYSLAFSFLEIVHMFFQPFNIMMGHRRSHLVVEPAVAFRKTVRVTTLHLHLCTKFIQQHLPLVFIPQPMNHGRYPKWRQPPVWRIGKHVKHLGHYPSTKQTAVGHVSLTGDIREDRIVVIEYGQFAILIGGDVIPAVGTLHGEQVADIHSDQAESLNSFLRRFRQTGRIFRTIEVCTTTWAGHNVFFLLLCHFLLFND